MTSVSKGQLAIKDADGNLDTGCGFTPACQPKWLQKCANVKVFLFVLTTFGIVQGREYYNLLSFDLLCCMQRSAHV